MSAEERRRLAEYGRGLARLEPPISDETAREAARILASAPIVQRSAA